MDLGLAGKAAIITGGSAGIGGAVAQSLARGGARAAIRTARLAIPHLVAAGGGSIVNVVNIGAKAPAAASVPTSVSRAAGIALTKAASKDLAKDNITVNAVCIGLIKSDQHVRRARATGRDLDELYAEM